jgi:hypothetical protein
MTSFTKSEGVEHSKKNVDPFGKKEKFGVSYLHRLLCVILSIIFKLFYNIMKTVFKPRL